MALGAIGGRGIAELLGREIKTPKSLEGALECSTRRKSFPLRGIFLFSEFAEGFARTQRDAPQR